MWYEQQADVGEWRDIQQLLGEHYGEVSPSSRWIFRGEFCCKDLSTKLEHIFDLYDVTTPGEKRECERRIIREFQRKASLYLESEPDKDDILEWLAVMQHHGAPTRFLDFTYSAYVAFYFALAQNPEGVVWAINASMTPETIMPTIREHDLNLDTLDQFREKLNARNDMLRIREDGDKLTDLAISCYLMENPLPLVYPVNPFRLNRRLTAQQGLFLLSGDITKSFVDNLRSHFRDNEVEMKRNIHRIKFSGGKDKRKEIMHELRQMNIGSESLFQGIDGFARSTMEFLARPYSLSS